MGFLLLALGLLSIAFGLVYFFKMKRMASAPFRKTGEIAAQPSVADPRGMISTEGRIIATSPARAPCSGLACVYYEVDVERHWEKTIKTEKGNRKETGKARITTEKGGAVFQLDDGSGPVSIDARNGADVDLMKSHEQRIPVGTTIPSEVVFGQMKLTLPAHLGTDRTVAFTASEKALTAEGSLYACGKLAHGAIVKPGWTSLILSRRGRAALVGGTKIKAAIGLVVGGLFTAGAIPAFLLAPGIEADVGAPEGTTTSASDSPPSAAASSPPPPSAPPRPTVATPAAPTPSPVASVAPASSAGKKGPKKK